MAAPGEFTSKTLATADRVDAAEASPGIDISDMENCVCYVTEHTAGTATLQVDTSPDGTQWAPLGTTVAAATDIVAATSVAAARPVEASNGMPLRVRQVRLRATAYTDGVYGLTVCGRVAR